MDAVGACGLTDVGLSRACAAGVPQVVALADLHDEGVDDAAVLPAGLLAFQHCALVLAPVDAIGARRVADPKVEIAAEREPQLVDVAVLDDRRRINALEDGIALPLRPAHAVRACGILEVVGAIAREPHSVGSVLDEKTAVGAAQDRHGAMEVVALAQWKEGAFGMLAPLDAVAARGQSQLILHVGALRRAAWAARIVHLEMVAVPHHVGRKHVEAVEVALCTQAQDRVALALSPLHGQLLRRHRSRADSGRDDQQDAEPRRRRKHARPPCLAQWILSSKSATPIRLGFE